MLLKVIYSNINIYSDSYSIISDENNITLDILLNKGTDSNNNIKCTLCQGQFKKRYF